MSKCLKDEKGDILIGNIKDDLISRMISKMQERNSGSCVCRQFVYNKAYTMMLYDVRSELEASKIIITVVIWPDESDAGYYVMRQITFYNMPENIRIWEEFCEKVSGGAAIWENELLGNFFIGHIVKNKVLSADRPIWFENLVVDRFIGRLDETKFEVGGGKGKAAKSTHSTRIKEFLEEE